MGNMINTPAFQVPPRQDDASALWSHDGFVSLQTKTAGKTPAVHIERPGARLTMLVSHGHEEDLGKILPELQQMSDVCNASIFAVEYPGYSISEAEAPCEEYCYEAVEAGYAYLVQKLGKDPRTVVPCGRSLGSGPAVHVASEHREIRALVLVSPLEAGHRAKFGKNVNQSIWRLDWNAIDPFQNYTKIKHVEATTCIIHGTANEVVTFHNGHGLYEALEARGKAATPLWVDGHGHMPKSLVHNHIKDFLAGLSCSNDKQASKGDVIRWWPIRTCYTPAVMQ